MDERHLLRAGTRWRKVTRHALPAGFRTHTLETGSLVPLPDGRVLVKVVRAVDGTDAVLAMGARSGHLPFFRTLKAGPSP